MLKKKYKKTKKPGRTSAIFRMLCCCVPVLFSVFVVSVIVKWLKQKKKHTEKDKKKQPWMCQTVVVASALQSTHL